MPDPGQAGIYFECGGKRLLGTLFLARGSAPKPCALLLHGIPGIEKNYDLAHALRARGWNSLIFHYQGSWGSAGRFTFGNMPEQVRCALDFLCSGAFPQVDADRLALVGHSLGGWAAVLEASGDRRARAVAALAPLAIPGELHFSPEQALASFTPWLPGLSPAEFLAEWQTLAQMEQPLEHAAEIAPRPLLVVHGAQDELIPVSQSERLFARAGEPKELAIHPQAGHSFIWERGWLLERVCAWLEQAV